MTRAHLVPESLSGFVWSRTQCADCNNGLGARAESGVKHDPTIRYAIEEALVGGLPELTDAFAEGQPYFVPSEQGPLAARFRDGAVQLGTTRLDTGRLSRAATGRRRGSVDNLDEKWYRCRMWRPLSFTALVAFLAVAAGAPDAQSSVSARGSVRSAQRGWMVWKIPTAPKVIYSVVKNLDCSRSGYCLAQVESIGKNVKAEIPTRWFSRDRSHSWHQVATSTQDTTFSKFDCAASAACVGAFGGLNTPPVAMRFDGHRWTKIGLLEGRNGVWPLSCATPNFCVVDSGGSLQTIEGGRIAKLLPPSSSSPATGGSSVSLSCPAVGYCMSVGIGGEEIRGSSTRFVPAPFSGRDQSDDELVEVSCWAVQACMAFDLGGDYRTYGSNGWSSALPLPTSLGALTCLTRKRCYALTSKPGLALYRWNGARWKLLHPVPLRVAQGAHVALACSMSSCSVAANAVILTVAATTIASGIKSGSPTGGLFLDGHLLGLSRSTTPPQVERQWGRPTRRLSNSSGLQLWYQGIHLYFTYFNPPDPTSAFLSGITVTGSDFHTPHGIHIGSSVAEVRAAYPQAQVSSHRAIFTSSREGAPEEEGAVISQGKVTALYFAWAGP